MVNYGSHSSMSLGSIPIGVARWLGGLDSCFDGEGEFGAVGSDLLVCMPTVLTVDTGLCGEEWMR